MELAKTDRNRLSSRLVTNEDSLMWSTLYLPAMQVAQALLTNFLSPYLKITVHEYWFWWLLFTIQSISTTDTNLFLSLRYCWGLLTHLLVGRVELSFKYFNHIWRDKHYLLNIQMMKYNLKCKYIFIIIRIRFAGFAIQSTNAFSQAIQLAIVLNNTPKRR